MKLFYKKMLLLWLLALAALTTMAQNAANPNTVPMADQLRSEGKIYVVVAVFLVLIIGLVTYLIRLDTKISRLQKQHH